MTDPPSEHTETLGARAVVVDDDELVRSVIQQVLRDTSIVVVGEADSPVTARSVIERYRPDLVVVDLALRGGNGEELIRDLRRDGDDARIVVFSAYANDPGMLYDAGANAVVEKPDFEQLGRVFIDLATELGVPNERRRTVARAADSLPPPSALSLSGFEAWRSFLRAVEHLTTGDAILCADVLPTPALQDAWDEVFRTDHRVALARMLASGRRAQDRISITPNGMPVALIVAGHPDAATAVFRRLTDTWGRELASGIPVGAAAILRDGDAPGDRLTETEKGVPTVGSEHLRMV